MYKIIGGDGREYGPVDESVIRTWIAEGRINASTRAQSEGMTEWRRLADFPEFADPFAPPPPPPPPAAEPVIPPIPTGDSASSSGSDSSPAEAEPGAGASAGSYGASAGSYGSGGSYGSAGGGWSAPGGSYGAGGSDPAAIVAHVEARGTELDLASCFERAVNVLKAQPALIVGATALVFLIMFAMSLLLNRWIGTLVAMVVNGPLVGGLVAVYLRAMRGQSATLTDVFSGFGPRALPLILANIAVSLLVGVGLLLCIIPGVFLAVVWAFTIPLVMDRGLDFWPAMETSRQVIMPRLFPMLALVLLCLVLSVAGVLACVVGTFITSPIAMMAVLFAYEDLFGRKSA